MNKETIDDFLNKVLLFNRMAGNSAHDTSLIETYDNLVMEELNELADAETDEDIIDAVVDIAVVCSYDLMLHGYDIEWLGKYIAGVDFKNMSDVPVNFESAKAWGQIMKDKDFVLMEHNLGGIFTNAMYFLHVWDGEILDSKSALNEVTSSNLSKFPNWKMSDEEIESEIETLSSQGRYENFGHSFYVEEGACYTIIAAGYDKETQSTYPKGKIMKASTFVEPNFSQYILTEGGKNE